ncbi:MAG: hypothetical protein WDA27_07925 [Actinomycetota bacterium]
MGESTVILRCTGKFLKAAGLKTAAIDSASSAALDGEWYANLLWFDRRKCVLLTHASTLFSAFVADIRKRDLAPAGDFLIRHVMEALSAEQLPADTFSVLDTGDVQVAKTASRVVLGCMNDMAWMLENDLAGQGGLARADIFAVNHQLRRLINSPNGYRHPIDLARDLAATRYPAALQPDSRSCPR